MVPTDGDAMTWPAPRDKGGVSFVTVAGIRYRAEGTGYSYRKLVRLVRDGSAVAVGGSDEK